MPSSRCSDCEQLEDLRLDRDVERGRRLVGDQQIRLARERHRDHHALPHAARQLVRIRVDALLGRRDADQLEHLDRDRRAPRRFDLPWCSRTASATWSPTVNTGLSDVIGSWKIIAIRLPRIARISSLGEREQVLAARSVIVPAGDAPGRRRDQPHDRQRGHALAAARLADDAERRRARESRTTRRRPRARRRARCGTP